MALNHSAASDTSRLELRDFVLVAIATVALVFMRAHAFSLPLENDECNYAYTAARLIEGDRLYVDVWDHQPPGVFALFSVVIGVFGDGALVIRWLAVAFSIASLLLIYRIATRAFGRTAGLAAAAAFAVLSSDPGTAGEGCNREVYMNACALAAVALLAGGRVGRTRIVFAGLLLGLASTLKTVMAAQWLLIALWLVWHRLAHRPSGTARREPRSSAIEAIQSLVQFSLGPALVWLAVAGSFYLSDRFTEAYEAVFAFNISYSGMDESYFRRFAGFFDPVFDVFRSALPIWLAAAVALPGIIALCPKRLGGDYGLICAFAIGSFLAVCLPGRFWPHYYYLLLPPMILLVTASIFRLSECFETLQAKRIVGVAGVLLLVLLTAKQLVHYRLLDADEIVAPHPVYRYRQAWAKAQGQRAASVTQLDDTIFVWGRDAGIYYYSGRRCASRYTMVGALADPSPGIERRRERLLDDLERHRPRLVFVVEPEFAELKAWLQARYVLAGKRAIDRHDRTPDKIVLIVLVDAERPIEEIDWAWPPGS